MPALEYNPPRACNLSKANVASFAESVAESVKYQSGDDLEPIVELFGGTIAYKSIWELEDSSSGSIRIEGEDEFEITLADHTSELRNRFTVAHELGHFFLHYLLRKVEGDDPGRMKAARYGSGIVEFEANWFAASFLMPEVEFRLKFDEFEGNIQGLAKHFRVSSAAARIRAESLGLH